MKTFEKPTYYDMPREGASQRVWIYQFICQLDVGQDVDDQTLIQLSHLAERARTSGRHIPEPVRGINEYTVEVEYEKEPSRQKRSQRLKRLVREHEMAWKRFGVMAKLVHKDWEFMGVKYRKGWEG